MGWDGGREGNNQGRPRGFHLATRSIQRSENTKKRDGYLLWIHPPEKKKSSRFSADVDTPTILSQRRKKHETKTYVQSDPRFNLSLCDDSIPSAAILGLQMLKVDTTSTR